MKTQLLSFIFDENGKGSSGRLSMWVTLAVTLRLVWKAAHGQVALTPEVITLLTTLLLAFIAWSAGPRMGAQLLAQMTGVAGALMSKAGHRPTPTAALDVVPVPPDHNNGDQG
jgi:hypothetical protein